MPERFFRNIPGRKHPVQFLVVMLLFIVAIALMPSLWIWPLAFSIWLILRITFRPGWFQSALAFGLIALVILQSAIVLFMIRDELGDKTLSGQETLIVPGAGVHGTEPSGQLTLRLEKATRLLKEYPQMPVIVTGYQAEGTLLSEAQAMREYLVSRGIREDRITEEDRARDTIRNFEYAGAIITEKNLAREVVIVTNEFHSFRCSYLAVRNGMDPISIPVHSPLKDLIRFLLREAGSWIKVQVYFGLSRFTP